jgi:hypothetical protein
MKWTWLTASAALLLVAVAPSAALAAGGPVPAVQGRAMAAPGSAYRYAAFGAGRNTIVKQSQAGAVSSLRVPGQYGVPGVGQDGSLTGLSADGRTLILAEIPVVYPPRTTTLLVLATGSRLAVRFRVRMPGWWTVDAISPDGRWLYLIQYKSSEISRYAVRAYDLAAQRLLTEPVVDPREPDEAMTGFPITRVLSAGDRWAYTLYFRPYGAPFVHALDTVHRRAICVDLPWSLNTDIGNGHLRLTPGGGKLQVVVDGVTGAQIDTRKLTVTAGAGHATSPRLRPVSSKRTITRESDAVPWGFVVLGILALGTLAVVVTGRRWPRRTDVRSHAPRSPVPVPPAHGDTRPEHDQRPGPGSSSR